VWPESEASDYEPQTIPPSPIELSPTAEEVLKWLKTRTRIHIRYLRCVWLDMQSLKHYTPCVDKEGVYGDVGTLMRMSDRKGKLVFEVVHGKLDEKDLPYRHDDVREIAKKLSSATKAYEEDVYGTWYILDNKRVTTRLASVQVYGDLGMLLQIDDKEAKEILQILKAMGKKGELLPPNQKWDSYFEYDPELGLEDIPPREDTPSPAVTPANSKLKRPREQYPCDMYDLTISDEDGSRKKQKAGDGYRLEKDDWKCGKCDQWNRVIWGTCHNESCNGNCAEDAIEVHKWVRVA
jgi:hypothetical protein